MHELFKQVLTEKNLSKAGELFSLEDRIIIDELPEVLGRVREIVSHSDFLWNYNDQSLVEICVARLTSAIRETRSIEFSAPHLVALLKTCLTYNLRPDRGDDPPHAKIASDIMSCLFLNYNKRRVMQLALPISVKFLHKGNRDLSRNMSSYLSLAAIENAEMLAQHIQPIIDSVISGNYSLARVLPQIYSVNREPIKNHVMTLISIMPNCDSSEKLALLSLFALIAKENPSLLESSVPQLCEGLSSSSTVSATLQVFYNMALVSASKPLIDHTPQFKEAASNFPKTTGIAIQVLCAIAISRPEFSQSTLDFLLTSVCGVEVEKHSLVLKELAMLVARYPHLLTLNVINKLSGLETEPRATSSTKAYIQELRQDFHSGSLPSVSEGVPKPIPSVNNTNSRVSISEDVRPVQSSSSNVATENCRSTGRLPTSHRSMTKLNTNASTGLDSRLGFHKSMTRLNTSQQNMARPFNSNHAARSITCISNKPGSKVVAGSASPTKSMSSGSMPGTEHQVLTVNVEQINQDLIRQVSSVLSYKDLALQQPTSSKTEVQQPNSSYTHLAPFSLPTSRASRRHPPYHNSGPIPTPSSQPPSLGLPPPVAAAVPPPPPQTSTLMSSSYQSVVGSSVPNRPSGILSNTLPNQRRRSSHAYTYHASSSGDNLDDQQGDQAKINHRMSVFEPYPMRDAVQHFCEKHLGKIRCYMESLTVKLPLPVKCTIEERKGKKHAKLHFACQGRIGEHCLYKNTFYTMKTRNPKIWIHLMFLALQARSSSAISTRETSVSSLKNCWEILKYEGISFVTLVTGAFPPSKDQDTILHELRSHRFFDVFEYNGPKQHWGCFLCNHPDRATYFIQDQEPVIEGQLKEKKGGKWKIFKKWKSRYFTLSGAKLSYKESVNGETGVTQSLDVGSIRSVKVSKEGRRNIPKAFEIFTNERTFILKAKDGSNAQEWVQCLSVAKARSQAQETNLKKLAYGGSLGRLNHGRPSLHSQLNSNMTLRTAV